VFFYFAFLTSPISRKKYLTALPRTPDAIRPARSDDSAERIADSRTCLVDRPDWIAGEIRPDVTPQRLAMRQGNE
jgi:hypothetical protein